MKKLLALIMAVAMVAACFAGCGAKKGNTIVEGKLTMGTNATFPPYEYTDDSGKIIGIDAEIAEAVADKLGLELVIKDMEFDSLLTAVQSNSIDIVFAGLTVDILNLALFRNDNYLNALCVCNTEINSLFTLVGNG